MHPFALILSTVTLATSLFASDATQTKSSTSPSHSRVNRMCVELSCTAEQRAAISQIEQRTKAATAADREALRSLRERMHAIITREAFDANGAKRVAREMETHRQAIASHRTNAWIETLAVLTPEQRRGLGKHRGQGRHGHKGGKRGHAKRKEKRN